jgi:hypothetical protein
MNVRAKRRRSAVIGRLTGALGRIKARLRRRRTALAMRALQNKLRAEARLHMIDQLDEATRGK